MSPPSTCSHSAGAAPGPGEACPPVGGMVHRPVIRSTTLSPKAGVLLSHVFQYLCCTHKHLKGCVAYALSVQGRLPPHQARVHTCPLGCLCSGNRGPTHCGCCFQLWPAACWACKLGGVTRPLTHSKPGGRFLGLRAAPGCSFSSQRKDCFHILLVIKSTAMHVE